MSTHMAALAILFEQRLLAVVIEQKELEGVVSVADLRTPRLDPVDVRVDVSGNVVVHYSVPATRRVQVVGQRAVFGMTGGGRCAALRENGRTHAASPTAPTKQKVRT